MQRRRVLGGGRNGAAWDHDRPAKRRREREIQETA
jgi:hypothetical protein